jgi:hypothetical protein
MTFGNAAEAELRLILWCRSCGHQVEPDSVQLVDRKGADTPVLDWRERLIYTRARKSIS